MSVCRSLIREVIHVLRGVGWEFEHYRFHIKLGPSQTECCCVTGTDILPLLCNSCRSAGHAAVWLQYWSHQCPRSGE